MKQIAAVYRTHAIADRVRSEIEALGVPASDVHVVPDDASPHTAGTMRQDAGSFDRLHTLGLPEDDVRTYQHAVRNGDYVVVASVVDDERIETIQGIMRDPEHAMNDDELRARYADEQLIAPSGAPLAAVGATSNIGAADDGRTTYADPMESGEHVRHDGVHGGVKRD